MDKGALALLIPIIVMSIPLAAVLFKGYHRSQELRIKEMEARVRLESGGGSEAIEELRQELAEVQERLDFAERMLAQGKSGESWAEGPAPRSERWGTPAGITPVVPLRHLPPRHRLLLGAAHHEDPGEAGDLEDLPHRLIEPEQVQRPA